jgi:hypothetical protein
MDNKEINTPKRFINKIESTQYRKASNNKVKLASG